MESILSTIAASLAPRIVTVEIPPQIKPLEIKLGQLLSAIVLGPTRNGRTNLLIQATRVAVQTSAPLQPGDQLSLRVERLTPVIHLKIMPDPPTPGVVRQNALLNVLPRQLPVAEVMNNLSTMVLRLGGKTPSPLKATTMALLENTPRIENLTRPKAIQETLLRSGHFLESRLARTVASPGTGTGWLNTVKSLVCAFTLCPADNSARLHYNPA